MTDAANVWGFCLVAALLGTAVGAFGATRRRRLTVAAAVAAFASLPILPDGVSLTACVFAFWDVPALTGAATAIYCGLWRRRDGELQNASTTDSAFFNGSRRETTFCAGALIVLGAALYASELNVFAFDVYRFGFASGVGLTVACVATAFASRGIAALCVGAYVATSAGLYANFFDAILDFGFWAFLSVAAILTGVRRVAERRREARRGGKRVETSNKGSVA
ncbi:MAG: hypothetical protein IJN32_07805, partial [Thermoguttaceae bacterium]|nr:hypothetical protein [Thermoguttaceae bacterium]